MSTGGASKGGKGGASKGGKGSAASKGGKGSAASKGGKGSAKGGKGSAKSGDKAAKSGAKGQKNSSSSSSSLISSIVYSIFVYFILAKGADIAADHPELLAAASDVRLKKNIDVSHYGMNEVLQLEPKSYHYINQDNKGTRHIGLMVQDVAKIMPELVVPLSQRQSAEFSTSDETMYGLKYQELIPVLINAIKELKGQVDELKA